MAKEIYSLKMELFYDGNEAKMKITANELQALQRFNCFVVIIYIQSWFTCQSAPDAPLNDIALYQCLSAYDDDQFRSTGHKMLLRKTWYLHSVLATVIQLSE